MSMALIVACHDNHVAQYRSGRDTGGPLAAAFARDRGGNYRGVLADIAIVSPLAALLVGTLGRYPDSERNLTHE